MTSSDPIKLLFATGPRERLAPLTTAMREVGGDHLPLYTVSEFPPPHGVWIPYHPKQSAAENAARIQRVISGKQIRFSGILLDARFPYWPLRRLAFSLTPWRTWVFFNPSLHHFLLRPGSLPTIARHLLWRTREFLTFQTNPGGDLYTFFWRLRHPSHFRRPWHAWHARQAATAIAERKRQPTPPPPPEPALAPGITVVIPSRDGGVLLDRLLPEVLRQQPGEIIVVDNGSTERWSPPEGVQVITSKQALSFAAAVNQGIHAARYSHVCLLNNDMVIEPGFFAALRVAFDKVPDLFCATAQIFFPPGIRREETGKAVLPPDAGATAFPLTCLDPLPGEDLSYVLYGSGGCSLYDTAWLRRLGAFDETYRPAYVEDLDIGYRGWLSGGATVFVAQARVTHWHRSTTKRFFSESDIRNAVELNWLRFLARAVRDPQTFTGLWRRSVERLNLLAAGHEPDPVPIRVLAQAPALASEARAPQAVFTDEEVLALGSGDLAVFPGHARGHHPPVAVASCYLPFPLAHGGAVRMYNLMRAAAQDGWPQVLVCFVDELAPPAPELLAICREIVLVRRRGSHYRQSTGRPDVVEEFDSPVFRAALKMMIRKHGVQIAQLEFTQMAQYAGLAPKSILVEHDITLDLYQQLLANSPNEETREQLARWDRFERQAWQTVDATVVMSDRDHRTAGPQSIVIPNGVDLDRYQPSPAPPEPNRLLFIGSFNHLPNLLALHWFLEEVWPRLASPATLHVIAGARHDYFLDFYRGQVRANIHRPNVEVEGFVADVRPAYRRATAVIAPLLASAGTNIKVMEAMAMGKAVISTSAGVHGLHVTPGSDFLLANDPDVFAQAIDQVLDHPQERQTIEHQARATVETRYGWKAIAALQTRLYQSLLPSEPPASAPASNPRG